MKKKLIVTIITVAIILIISTFVTNNLFGRITITLFAGGIFILQGLRRIDEDPPHKGILTVLGERQTRTVMKKVTKIVKDKNGREVRKKFKERTTETVYFNEGWRFSPIYPLVFGFIPVNVERKPFDIEVTTRTPDRAQVKIRISLTLRPLPKYLINYENSGGFEGVKQHLGGEIEERVREWAEGLREGPMDWREIYQAKLEAASILIKRVAGNGAVNIPSGAQEIPTNILMLYTEVPRIEGTDEDEKKVTANEWSWIKNKWEKVERILNNLEEEEKEHALEKAKERKRQVQKIRSGEGDLEITDLGMRLERLNISNVEVTGEAGKAADQQAKEQEEMQAEELEITHLLNQVKRLREEGRYSPEQALEAFQTERNKVTKAIDEKKLNVSPETRKLIKSLGSDVLKSIFQKKGGI
jgi:hypothetical protein